MGTQRTGRVIGALAAAMLAGAGTAEAAVAHPGSAPPAVAPAGGPVVAAPASAIPSTGAQVSGAPLAHTTVGTVFAEEGTSRVAVMSDNGASSTPVPGFDPSVITKAFGCGTSFVTDNGSFAPVAPTVAAGAFQWRNLATGDTASRAPASGRVLVGATPDGWAEFDEDTSRLIGVRASDLHETALGQSVTLAYGCDATGYATIAPTATHGAVVDYCTWAGGSGSCVDLVNDPHGYAYEVLAVFGTTVVYQSLAVNAGTGDPEFQVWRVTRNGSPSLVHASTGGDATSAAITGSGTAFFQEAGPTTPDPGLVGFTPVGGSATTWAAPGELNPMVVRGSSGPLFASVGYAEGGISTLGPGGLGATLPWWMTGTPTYRPMTPHRILDTRYGVGAARRLVRDGETVHLAVAGVAGIPSSGVGAVDLNVTVVGPKAGGYIAAFPSDASRPTASNLNYARNQVVANHVIAKVGGDGRVSLYASRSTNLVADVTGWYPAGSAYRPLTPHRILDTRNGLGVPKGRVPGGGTRTLHVLGAAGVPGAGVDSVVVNLTDVGSVRGGYVTAWPTGRSRPTVSNVNYKKGQTFPGLAIVKVGSGGSVNLYTSAASHLVADIVGWVPTGSEYSGLDPARIRDTRTGIGGGRAIRPAGSTMTVQVTGRGGVPPSGVKAVMLNVTVAQPAGSGYLTVFPSNAARPTASTLNYRRGNILANSIVAAVGADGAVKVYVSARTQVVVDVSGWFAAG